jgi:hypothetical protein
MPVCPTYFLLNGVLWGKTISTKKVEDLILGLLDAWKWKQYDPYKLWELLIPQHSVMSLKTWILNHNTVRTSNYIYIYTHTHTHTHIHTHTHTHTYIYIYIKGSPWRDSHEKIIIFVFWGFIAGCPKFTSDIESTTFLPYSKNGQQACKHMLALTHTYTNVQSLVFLFWKLRGVKKLVRQIYTLVMNSCHMAPPPSTSGPAFLYHQCVCTTDTSPIFTCSGVLENYHCKRTIVISSTIL